MDINNDLYVEGSLIIGADVRAVRP
jgi:hypothetical protein